jgi:dipeptidyl aminopeptidase/acylaminoacyl peptidase
MRQPSLRFVLPSIFVLFAAFVASSAIAQPHPLEDFTRPVQHDIVSISPDGTYIAATLRKPVNNKNRMLLAIIDREANKLVRIVDPEEEGEIDQVMWVSDTRLFLRRAWASSRVEQYFGDPLVVAINVDGTRKRTFYDRIVNTLIDDDDHILVERCIRRTQRSCHGYVQKVDTDGSRSGERIADAPEIDVDFVTDNAGTIRFAVKEGDDHRQKIWIRKGDGWEIFQHEPEEGGFKIALIGASRDNSAMFLLRERDDGPDVIERYDFADGRRTVVMSDPDFDPSYILWSADGRQPIGAAYGLGRPQMRFWDPADPDAKLLGAIQAQFPQDAVWFHRGSRDGRHIIVAVRSDRDPGSYYLFDRQTKRMDLVLRGKPWLNPERMVQAEPVSFLTRDGLRLHGYLTLPAAATGKPPLVVMPHGGPFGVTDDWEYDTESQLLAAHGYAVLRINFRGSGGRGRTFERAGYRQWGLKIMDDIVDGTRWAAADGRVDPQKICIFGTSFGGYAALMGAIREPDLYRCAISTAGVTSLPLMRKWGDIQRSESGRNYLNMAVGDDEKALYDQSPVKYAADIRVPILLVHGNHDQRVSFEHARAMVAAMEKAEKSMETFFFGDETHGIYGTENRQAYYERVLGFLRRHLGGAAPAPPTDGK